MPIGRRSLLAGVAAAGAALAGCNSGNDRNAPRPPGSSKTSDDGNGPPGTFTETDGVLVPGEPENMIQNWSEGKGENGNLTLSVELKSIDPDAIQGRLRANFQTRSGESKQFVRNFSMAGKATETVTMEIPVSYEEYNKNMSLPGFTVTNLTEQ